MANMSVYLPDQEAEDLEALASAKGMTKNQVLREALKASAESATDEVEAYKRKPMIIAVASYKGGVGKTTTSANLGVCLAQDGHKTLIIDTDGQGSVSQLLRLYDPKAQDPCIADVMLTDNDGNRERLYNIMISTVYEKVEDPETGERILMKVHEGEVGRENLYLVPSHFGFADADGKLRADRSQMYISQRLQRAIEELLEDVEKQGEEPFEYIIIDCPPALGTLATNMVMALEAGNNNSMTIIPVKVDGFGLAGLQDTIKMLAEVSKEAGIKQKPYKILYTVVERNTVAYKTGREIINSSFNNPETFAMNIPKGTVVIESTLALQPVVEYDPNCPAAIALYSIADEVMESNNG